MAARAKRTPRPDFTFATEPAAPPPPAFGAFRTEQLTQRCQCRFPVDTVAGEHRFCGRPTLVSDRNRHGSWCDEHLDVVFIARSTVPGSLRKKGVR